LIWPVNLTFSYPHWNISATDPWAYFWPALTAGCGLLIYFLRRYAGRSVEVGVVFFASTLVPVSGAIMLYTFLYSYVADHYQYVASIGLIALAAAGMSIALGAKQKVLLPAAGTGLILLLAFLTWRQCGMYGDIETLWRTTCAQNPGSWMAHNNLGNCLRHEGKPDEAIAQFKEVLQIDPQKAEAYYNIGMTLMQKGKPDDAIAQYRQALQLDPNYLDACVNLGDALLQEGKTDDAMAQYLAALKIRPNDATAHYNLGTVLFGQGKVDEAIAHFQQAVQAKPDYQEAQDNLGTALMRAGRLSEAFTHFREALRINPDDADACNSLAWILATVSNASLRDGKQAVELAGHANEVAKGQNPTYLRTLAAADAELRRFDEATQNAQAAIKLAQASGQSDLVERLNNDLKLYSAGRSFPAGK
ncbi:MAG TPA: tetratricopeptide repeat protein, partial [Verrucomicrobiae bacterium]|nr:tetratricopeptide repeat protein [Verrucomicrobiae bacterium]